MPETTDPQLQREPASNAAQRYIPLYALAGYWLPWDTRLNCPVHYNPAGHGEAAVREYVARLNTEYAHWLNQRSTASPISGSISDV